MIFIYLIFNIKLNKYLKDKIEKQIKMEDKQEKSDKLENEENRKVMSE